MRWMRSADDVRSVRTAIFWFFGPHVDGDVIKQAKAAGASELVACGAAVERMLGRLQRSAA